MLLVQSILFFFVFGNSVCSQGPTNPGHQSHHPLAGPIEARGKTANT